MIRIGAVYCVYDASNFLYESVYRIYHLMDKIVFILNTKPWCGDPVPGEPFETYKKILSIEDPENKIEVLTGTWEKEALQRNVGLNLLKGFDIDWCLIIDDDELYNASELTLIIKSLDTAVHAAYLFHHQIYWKNRNTIIDEFEMSIPTLARTDGIVKFNENRGILVNKPHTWFTISANNIVCHHMSYIRSDSEMLRKIKNFSHAKDIISSWYEEKWLKWDEDMVDLHPLEVNGFRRTISVSKSKYRLESFF